MGGSLLFRGWSKSPGVLAAPVPVPPPLAQTGT